MKPKQYRTCLDFGFSQTSAIKQEHFKILTINKVSGWFMCELGSSWEVKDFTHVTLVWKDEQRNTMNRVVLNRGNIHCELEIDWVDGCKPGLKRWLIQSKKTKSLFPGWFNPIISWRKGSRIWLWAREGSRIWLWAKEGSRIWLWVENEILGSRIWLWTREGSRMDLIISRKKKRNMRL